MGSPGRMPPRPTPEQQRVYDVFISRHWGTRDASRAIGVPRGTVLEAVRAVRLWRKLSGWNDRYGLALRSGFCRSDAELHATQEADYRTRTNRPKR